MRKLALGPVVVAMLFAFGTPGAHAAVKFEVKGQWTCKDGAGGTGVKPLAGARVELFRSRSYWRDEKITTRHTGADGRYAINVNASDNFDLYIKVLLHDDDGVELENWYSPFTWETTTSTKRSRSGTIDLGTWQIDKDGSGTPKCAIWQGVRNAYGDYRQVVGARPPSPKIKVEAEFPCCGTPFTLRSAIQWPGGSEVRPNYTVPSHEFAHTVRHTFDGNIAHFGLDAARYLYPRVHESCKVTNQGFAFNEGWAEYWAREFRTCPPGTNFEQEGNVAGELARLERCTSRPNMVRVLRENPGRIHSIGEFQARHAALFGGCAVPLTTTTAPAQPVLTAQQQIRELQRQIAAQRKLVTSLERQASAAKRRARNPGRCTAGRCAEAMEKLIEPSALAAQAQQAELVLDRLKDGLAAARKAAFDPAKQFTLADSLLKGEDAFEKANQKILVAGLNKGLREIKTEPGFNRGERSELFKTMDKRADRLARARRRGQETPASVESLFAAPSAPTDEAKKVR